MHWQLSHQYRENEKFSSEFFENQVKRQIQISNSKMRFLFMSGRLMFKMMIIAQLKPLTRTTVRHSQHVCAASCIRSHANHSVHPGGPKQWTGSST